MIKTLKFRTTKGATVELYGDRRGRIPGTLFDFNKGRVDGNRVIFEDGTNGKTWMRNTVAEIVPEDVAAVHAHFDALDAADRATVDAYLNSTDAISDRVEHDLYDPNGKYYG